MKHQSLIRTGVFIVILSLLAIFQSQAATYFVWTNSPSDGPGTSWDSAYHTIQGAVDVATNGDTVLVTNGVYNQGITIVPPYGRSRVAITQEISVIGISGAQNTFIAGEPVPAGNYYGIRGVYLTSNAFLTGFTITNGCADWGGLDRFGGGIFVLEKGTISNCYFVGNYGSTGGGIYCNKDALITDCYFYFNRANAGGAIAFSYGGLAQHCVLSNNYATYRGGGIFLDYGGEVKECLIEMNDVASASPWGGTVFDGGGGAFIMEGGMITNCIFYGNTVSSNYGPKGAGVCLMNGGLLVDSQVVSNKGATSGGGAYVSGSGIIERCTFVGNETTIYSFGGGACNLGGIVRNCRFENNQGGGAYCGYSSHYQTTGKFENCVFINNNNFKVWGGGGGGVYIENGIIENCLIVSNSARGGGGIGFSRGGYAINCTIVGNSATIAGGGIYLWYAGEVLYNSINYDNIAPTGNNYYIEGTGSFSYSCTTPDPAYLGGTGNITNPPLFIDALDRNYRLRYDSSCRDSGTNKAAMFRAKDLDGKPRIVNRTVDMGAYEFHAFSVFNDYDRNGKSDLTLYDTNSGNWYIKGVSGEVLAWEQQWGGKGFQPVAGDYDGDSFADLTVVSDAERQWYALSMTGSNLIWGQQWGWDKSFSVRGDYDGDGKNDLGIFGDGRWYVFSATNSVISWAKQWGWSGAIPVSGDYDGDGKADYAVFDGKLGNWYILSASNTVLAWAFQWGWDGAIPVSGDFDGDGKSDLAVYDDVQGNWFIVTLDLKVLAWYTQWGYEKTIPVSGDYDGDGKSDLGVYDSSLGKWYIRSINGKVIAWDDNWGAKGLVPVR